MGNLSKGRLSVRCWGAVILLLLVFFAQLIFSARRLSLTSDEPPNLGAGYTYLATGETWHISSLGQPPLPFAWAALPVVLGNPHIPLETLPNWRAFPLPPYLRALFPLLGPVDQLEVAGRVPMMLLGMLLGSLVFRWATDLFGAKGGILALALTAFDPTMLAHAPLATGDVGVALSGFAVFFVSWRWARASRASLALRRSDLWWGIVVGLLAGVTMAAKTSGFMWVGLVMGIIAVVEVSRFAHKKTWVPAVLRILGRSAVIVMVAFLLLWAVYGFRIGSVRVGSYLLTVPAPTHWEGLIRQMDRSSTRMLFLAGEADVGGWWWYFPFAFLIKNPIPLLVMWIGAVVVSVCRQTRSAKRTRSAGRSLTGVDFLFLLIFPGVYMVAAIYSGINIGYRHLLSIHPFLFVLAAQWVDVVKKPGFFRKTGFLRTLWLALWIWYVVGTVRVFPHYLAYFNELVGGPSNGYRYLVDSNLDWGQSFKTLRQDLEHLDIRPPLRIGHYWHAGPELYGLQYEPLPPLPNAPPAFSPRLDPPPGTYVLGATLLYSGPGDLEQYEWFKHHPPIARPGHALFVFRVDPHEPPATWIAQCVKPAPPLEQEVILREFHTQSLRLIYFDCTQSWVYPEGGRTSGWYALHAQVLQEDTPFFHTTFVTRYLEQVHMAYDHRRYDGLAPAFRLYEFQPSMQTSGYTSAVRVAPPGIGPMQVVAERQVITAPLSLEGPLSFLGYRLLDVGAEAVTMETWWEVTERQLRPLSIMAHLVRDDGHPVAVADGLGVPVEGWQVGDVLVQYHHFPLASDLQVNDEKRAWLQTGVYWLDTLERQEVTGPGQNTGDRILLEEIRLADEP